MDILNEEEVDYLRGLTYFVEPQHLKVLSTFLDYGDRIDLNDVFLGFILQLIDILKTVDTVYTIRLNTKLRRHIHKRWGSMYGYT